MGPGVVDSRSRLAVFAFCTIFLDLQRHRALTNDSLVLVNALVALFLHVFTIGQVGVLTPLNRDLPQDNLNAFVQFLRGFD